MAKCRVCGGNAVGIGNGKFRCGFCGNVFAENEELSSKTSYAKTKNASGGEDVFEKNIKGILEISCAVGREAWVGSGYLVDEGGYAITNAHVAAGKDGKPCRSIFARVNGETVPAEVIALADDKAGAGNGVDLALIKLSRMPREARKLEFESFDNVKTGEQVYVIGNSLGDGTCITCGIVSDRRRVLSGKTLLMTDCAINGGNSGGPIFNQKGLVIGTICSSRINHGNATEGMNYAIPSDIVLAFLQAKLPRSRFSAGIFSRPPKSSPPPVPAKCPCPKCGSWNTNVQNGIFYCMDCDFEG